MSTSSTNYFVTRSVQYLQCLRSTLVNITSNLKFVQSLLNKFETPKINSESRQFFCLSLESSLQTPRGGESLPLWPLVVFLDRLNFATSSPKTSPVLKADMRSSNSPFCPFVKVPSLELSPVLCPLQSELLDLPRDLPTDPSRLEPCFLSIVRFLSCGKKIKSWKKHVKGEQLCFLFSENTFNYRNELLAQNWCSYVLSIRWPEKRIVSWTSMAGTQIGPIVERHGIQTIWFNMMVYNKSIIMMVKNPLQSL